MNRYIRTLVSGLNCDQVIWPHNLEWVSTIVTFRVMASENSSGLLTNNQKLLNDGKTCKTGDDGLKSFRFQNITVSQRLISFFRERDGIQLPIHWFSCGKRLWKLILIKIFLLVVILRQMTSRIFSACIYIFRRLNVPPAVGSSHMHIVISFSSISLALNADWCKMIRIVKRIDFSNILIRSSVAVLYWVDAWFTMIIASRISALKVADPPFRVHKAAVDLAWPKSRILFAWTNNSLIIVTMVWGLFCSHFTIFYSLLNSHFNPKSSFTC